MSVAEQLRQAREARNLTIDQVADFTKVRADHIRAVEEGNYAVFSAPVYLRGFIRTYSTFLKLEVPPIMAALDSELGGKSRYSESLVHTEEPKGLLDVFTLQLSKLNWRKTLVIVAIIAGIGLLVAAVFAWRHYRTSDPLRDLQPGIYQKGRTSSVEKLPLPPAKK